MHMSIVLVYRATSLWELEAYWKNNYIVHLLCYVKTVSLSVLISRLVFENKKHNFNMVRVSRGSIVIITNVNVFLLHC